MRIKRGIGDVIFDSINTIVLILIAFAMLFPFWHVLVSSVLPYDIAIQSSFHLFPEKMTFSAYAYIFSSESLMSSLMVSLIVTVTGTLYQLVITTCAAFAMTKKSMPGRRLFFGIFLMTMFFNGGLIANYLLMQKLNLLNNILVLILPFGMSTYNMIIVKTFFEALPKEMEESARIDGASTFRLFINIILPLSVPVIATFSLFFAVDLWNGWYNAMIYINDKDKWPFIMLLRDILIKNNVDSMSSNYVNRNYMVGDSIKMAVIIVSVVPIMIIYPFVQKYFVKGIMIGAVKE